MFVHVRKLLKYLCMNSKSIIKGLREIRLPSLIVHTIILVKVTNSSVFNLSINKQRGNKIERNAHRKYNQENKVY